ncbi:Uncharacterised protein [Mycobacteroides abscessus subsp. abscessus]|nr:Uncharacterised protein [Mycobacteroides abscessus subsp. abscessus]
MNVACTPSMIATSLTTLRKVITLSAMERASAYRKSISCWPGAPSWWLNSTEMPMDSSASIACRRKLGAASCTAWSKYPASSAGMGAVPSSGMFFSRKNSISGCT